ncbi:haloacid dehalogenase superfamily, subfamily IA, variant 3 with third motif having DD or ED [Rubritalea squalenifaciens DSM 18772]|uniref:Haloacid dehalogenase superfamily, subfamily IA, variant 3 with third motif having DD or ED n=2 Tax=Rubritalea TaxID=361050 RepID=A0A1M6L104_9BACT|nr:HAD-IA family hydrolase [Rubritalea squalenifaciens]SHJ64910.1 haloacid dehalogenase superfamily, subfamily IA, variant 3 with third motif having DD or ED [Rubritalea squalenifaciens DSM 18772]
MLTKAKAVLFDFDGVILDSEWPIYQTWLDLFKSEGHDLPIPTYVQCIGSDFDTWSPEKHLEDLTGKSYDWHTINPARQVEILAALENPVALPGVNELFQLLSDKGIPVAVVSSSSHDWVDSWLEQLDLIKFTQTIVCKGDAPRIKPAPDLYLEAARRLELDPADCLVIEDSLNGVKAAIAAGCQTIAVPSRLTSCLDFSLATHTIPSLTHLVETEIPSE